MGKTRPIGSDNAYTWSDDAWDYYTGGSYGTYTGRPERVITQEDVFGKEAVDANRASVCTVVMPDLPVEVLPVSVPQQEEAITEAALEARGKEFRTTIMEILKKERMDGTNNSTMHYSDNSHSAAVYDPTDEMGV